VPGRVALVWLGHADGPAVVIRAPLSLALSAFADLALRFGWSLQVNDPTMTLAQIVCSSPSVIACYATASPSSAVVMPMQVMLLQSSHGSGWLGIASAILGLIAVHVLAGIAPTTLFVRNYYFGLPDELLKAAMLGGASFWQIFRRIVLPLSAVDPDGEADLAIHLDLQRLSLWRGVFRRRQQADHGRAEQSGQYLRRGQGIQRGHGGSIDRGAANADCLCRCRQILRSRPVGRCRERLTPWAHSAFGR